MPSLQFRLGQVPLIPRQVIPNIFAASMLMSTSILTYAASNLTLHVSTSTVTPMPCQCRVKPHPACQHFN
ncbi:hypothetical protein BDR05DRAFT_805090 [Suillus weaverae]|nr:hypothetical protein BDR05DRAFT_805090 [Suillus weaverae]